MRAQPWTSAAPMALEYRGAPRFRIPWRKPVVTALLVVAALILALRSPAPASNMSVGSQGGPPQHSGS
ncbi:MAG: hypothetical protein AB2A00_08100 [Myxococcota bacterium]